MNSKAIRAIFQTDNPANSCTGRLLMLDCNIAEVLGLNESIVLQQVHYCLEIKREADKSSENLKNGKYWVYNSIENWKKEHFKFWSVETVKRTFKKLQKMGLLIAEKFNAKRYDQTKWYSIAYDVLKNLLQHKSYNGGDSHDGYAEKDNAENNTNQTGQVEIVQSGQNNTTPSGQIKPVSLVQNVPTPSGQNNPVQLGQDDQMRLGQNDPTYTIDDIKMTTGDIVVVKDGIENSVNLNSCNSNILNISNTQNTPNAQNIPSILADIKTYFEEQTGNPMTNTALNDIRRLISKDGGGVEGALVCLAIDKSREANAHHKWSYAKKVITESIKKGILTAEAYDRNEMQRSSQYPGTGNRQTYTGNGGTPYAFHAGNNQSISPGQSRGFANHPNPYARITSYKF